MNSVNQIELGDVEARIMKQAQAAFDEVMDGNITFAQREKFFLNFIGDCAAFRRKLKFMAEVVQNPNFGAPPDRRPPEFKKERLPEAYPVKGY